MAEIDRKQVQESTLEEEDLFEDFAAQGESSRVLGKFTLRFKLRRPGACFPFPILLWVSCSQSAPTRLLSLVQQPAALILPGLEATVTHRLEC